MACCSAEMRKLLRDGTTLIVDRYVYSGVAFSAAKVKLRVQFQRVVQRVATVQLFREWTPCFANEPLPEQLTNSNE